MSDIQASLLLPQLKKLEKNLQIRDKICMKYEKALLSLSGISLPKILKNTKHARHLFTVWVDPLKRNDVIHKLQSLDVGVTVNYRSIHLLSYYKNQFGINKGTLPISERIGDSTITLPMYPKMTEAEVNYVIDAIKSAV